MLTDNTTKRKHQQQKEKEKEKKKKKKKGHPLGYPFLILVA